MKQLLVIQSQFLQNVEYHFYMHVTLNIYGAYENMSQAYGQVLHSFIK